MIFAEAVTDLALYPKFKEAVKVPSSPTSPSSARRRSTPEQLGAAGVDIVLYCCSAYRAMNAAALKVLPDHPRRRHTAKRPRAPCRPVPSSTSFSATTRTKTSSTSFSRRSRQLTTKE